MAWPVEQEERPVVPPSNRPCPQHSTSHVIGQGALSASGDLHPGHCLYT